ncbi:outer membrane beta-barrel protein, partial [Legionella sp.]
TSTSVFAPSPVPFININNQINPNPSPVVANSLINNYKAGLPNPNANIIQATFSNLTRGTLDYRVGGNFSGHLGYRICNFRAEGELLFNYSPLSTVKVAGASISRHVTLTNPVRLSGQTVLGAGLINGYYDFYDEEMDPTWVPYVGLGIGYSYLRNTISFTVPFLFTDAFSISFRNNESSPIGQAILGISYFTSDDLSIGLDYRYLTTKSLSGTNSRLQTHTINLNFNYYFSD